MLVGNNSDEGGLNSPVKGPRRRTNERTHSEFVYCVCPLRCRVVCCPLHLYYIGEKIIVPLVSDTNTFDYIIVSTFVSHCVKKDPALLLGSQQVYVHTFCFRHATMIFSTM